MALKHSKYDCHITNNALINLIFIHLPSPGIQSPFLQGAYFWAQVYFSDFLERVVSALSGEWREEGGIYFHWVGALLFPIQDYAQQGFLCIFTASNSLSCHAQKKNYWIFPRHFTHKLSVPIPKPQWDGDRRYGGCLGLEGGWEESRWRFGRVITTLDIYFNELATQQ